MLLSDEAVKAAVGAAGLDPDVVGVTALCVRQGATYEEALRRTFTFLRRHGRYTSRTLTRYLLDAADRAEANRAEFGGSARRIDAAGYPVLLSVDLTSTYDAMTEVKHGGMVGTLVVAPEGNALLGVHAAVRREGYGTALLLAAAALPPVDGGSTDRFNRLRFWVASTNRIAQQFLLDAGFRPVQFTAGDAVCYAVDADDCDAVAPQEEDAEPRGYGYRRFRHVSRLHENECEDLRWDPPEANS